MSELLPAHLAGKRVPFCFILFHALNAVYSIWAFSRSSLSVMDTGILLKATQYIDLNKHNIYIYTFRPSLFFQSVINTCFVVLPFLCVACYILCIGCCLSYGCMYAEVYGVMDVWRYGCSDVWRNGCMKYGYIYIYIYSLFARRYFFRA